MKNEKEIQPGSTDPLDVYRQILSTLENREKTVEHELEIIKNGIKDYKLLYKLLIKTYEKLKPFQIRPEQRNAPLSRDLIRDIFRDNPNSMTTIDFIGLVYPDKTNEEKNELINLVSVMLNQLVKLGEIEKYRPSGKKGNFYRWIKK